MIIFKLKTIFILCAFFLHGCSSIEKQIEGQYFFIFPSGEFQLLSIESNNTYIQKIYSSEKDFRNSCSPKFESNGNWIDEGKDFTFNHWLSYCYDSDPKQIRKYPIHVTMANVYFYNSIFDLKDYISIYMENGYVFKRIEKKVIW